MNLNSKMHIGGGTSSLHDRTNEDVERVLTSHDIHVIKNYTIKTDSLAETRELLDAHRKIQNDLSTLTYKLAVLESVAMESTDANVVELRNQLFTVVKMIHSDEIAEIVDRNKHQYENEARVEFAFSDESEVREDKSINVNKLSNGLGTFIKIRQRWGTIFSKFKKNATTTGEE